MRIRDLFWIGGAALIIGGLGHLLFKLPYKYTGEEIPPKAAIAVILIGSVLFAVSWAIYKFIPEKPDKSGRYFYICKDCLRALPKRKHKSGKCPECGKQMEDLLGFYDRHPELKDKQRPPE